LHTKQRLSGCDLLSDGSVRRTLRVGYDGRDFISFSPESGTFVAADGAAQITQRKWKSEGYEDLQQDLGLRCAEWLQKFVGYGQEALEHKEPPDVHVSGKEEHGILTLSCHTYGFYPGIIAINWMKGDEIRDQETEWGGIVPNSDGTFHSWARIEALPGEREQYRCRVEHAGMPEPGIFAWGEPGNGQCGNWACGNEEFGRVFQELRKAECHLINGTERLRLVGRLTYTCQVKYISLEQPLSRHW
ncbi:class I histocompatibility antigen, F10 alpha chain-like, partial [Empidonax traillii]|uniref:class I histocompatibility antigen, F10 alpha chain-like n=1 Tax=Empidonax traillii TaxID=164674 RepID=UPI000FFDA66F